MIKLLLGSKIGINDYIFIFNKFDHYKDVISFFSEFYGFNINNLYKNLIDKMDMIKKSNKYDAYDLANISLYKFINDNHETINDVLETFSFENIKENSKFFIYKYLLDSSLEKKIITEEEYDYLLEKK